MTRIVALVLLMGCGDIDLPAEDAGADEEEQCVWLDGTYRVTHRLDSMADRDCPMPAAGLVKFSDEDPGGEVVGTEAAGCTGSSEWVDECTLEHEEECDVYDDPSGGYAGTYQKLLVLTLDDLGATGVQDINYTLPTGESLRCLVHTFWRKP